MRTNSIYEEVKKRWAERGCYSSSCKNFNTGKRSFRVGYIECGFFTVVGEGESWEEALTNADKKDRELRIIYPETEGK